MKVDGHHCAVEGILTLMVAEYYRWSPDDGCIGGMGDGSTVVVTEWCVGWSVVSYIVFACSGRALLVC